MEIKFRILLTELPVLLLDRLRLNLSTDKSVFVEDEPPEWQPLYAALEFIALPEEIESPRPDALLMSWDVNFDPDEMRQILEPLHAASLEPAIMVLHDDEGGVIQVLSLDEDDWYEERALVPAHCSIQDESALAAWMLAKADERTGMPM